MPMQKGVPRVRTQRTRSRARKARQRTAPARISPAPPMPSPTRDPPPVRTTMAQTVRPLSIATIVDDNDTVCDLPPAGYGRSSEASREPRQAPSGSAAWPACRRPAPHRAPAPGDAPPLWTGRGRRAAGGEKQGDRCAQARETLVRETNYTLVRERRGSGWAAAARARPQASGSTKLARAEKKQQTVFVNLYCLAQLLLVLLLQPSALLHHHHERAMPR